MYHPVSKRHTAASVEFYGRVHALCSVDPCTQLLSLFTPIIILSSIVCFRYSNTHLNFAVSSLVLLVTLVHRNEMEGSMSGLPYFSTHSNSATME